MTKPEARSVTRRSTPLQMSNTANTVKPLDSKRKLPKGRSAGKCNALGGVQKQSRAGVVRRGSRGVHVSGKPTLCWSPVRLQCPVLHPQYPHRASWGLRSHSTRIANITAVAHGGSASCSVRHAHSQMPTNIFASADCLPRKCHDACMHH